MNDAARGLARLASFVLVFAVIYYFTSGRNEGLASLVGKPSPNFQFKESAAPGAAAQARDLASLYGRVVVLDFWAPWCEACRVSSPMVHKVANDLRDNAVTFLSVNVDQQPSAQQDFHVRVLPTFVVIDTKNVVHDVIEGVPSEEKLRKTIQAASES